MPMNRPGYDALWGWFGLSRASFLVMPRILMHEMPDEWQSQMAELLEQYDDAFNRAPLPGCKVMAVGERGRFQSWPDWLLRYRRPDVDRVNELRVEVADRR